MHILGELIHLPEVSPANGKAPLPLPWWIRAPLGLLSHTNVFVSIVQSPIAGQPPARRSPRPRRREETGAGPAPQETGAEPNWRPLGDLIVSVINPTRDLLHIQCRKHDETGILHSIFHVLHGPGRAEQQLNIALAEGVTVDHRGYYHASLVCELLDKQVVVDEKRSLYDPEFDSREKEVQAVADSIRKALKDKGFVGWYNDVEPEVTPQLAFRKLRWFQPGTSIRHGLIHDCDWHAKVRECAEKDEKSGAKDITKEFDLTRAVVSADSQKRVARFVFPKRGAVTISIEHADTPGALRELTRALMNVPQKLNLLSTLLRRGGAGPGNAVLVAVCEPTQATPPKETLELIRGAVGHLPVEVEEKLSDPSNKLELDVNKGLAEVSSIFSPRWRISPPRDWEQTLYLKHPDDIGVKIPLELRPIVRQIRLEEIKPGHVPVFLSRRFAGKTHRSDMVIQKIHAALNAHKCQVIEATPKSGTLLPTTYQVESRLWAARMGIVLVLKLEGTVEALSMNLAHEYGFISGQGKPVVFLIENHLRERLSQQLSNVQGLVTSAFADGDEAFDDQDSNSVYAKVGEWLNRVRLQSLRA